MSGVCAGTEKMWTPLEMKNGGYVGAIFETESGADHQTESTDLVEKETGR